MKYVMVVFKARHQPGLLCQTCKNTNTNTNTQKYKYTVQCTTPAGVGLPNLKVKGKVKNEKSGLPILNVKGKMKRKVEGMGQKCGINVTKMIDSVATWGKNVTKND